jgi:membrane-bound lytic murein transglycosylase B
MNVRRPVLALAVPAALVVGALAPGPAGAQANEQAAAPAAPLPAGVARLGFDLAGVAVEGAAARAAQAAYDATAARLAAAVTARTTAEAELAELAVRDATLTARIAERTEARKAASLRLVAARRAVQDVAVSTYILSSTQDEVTALVDFDASDRIANAQALAGVVEEQKAAEQEAARVEVDDASDDVDAAQRERNDVRERQRVVTEARDRAAADEAAATAELGVRLYEVQQARAVATVRGADFALVALDAYVKAAASQPRCGIQWWAIAGISKVEGRHGTYGGARLEADGQVSRPIIGIPLDGTNNTRAIGDSDGGALDGDPNVDRAVGPMQFIPTTWARWGRDGDADGDEDPQNLYDAAAAAAAYLCNGRSMADEAGIRAGYFSYNHSEAYVENVLAHARRYQAFRIPSPPPPPPVAPTLP